jgi:hypothetical protein
MLQTGPETALESTLRAVGLDPMPLRPPLPSGRSGLLDDDEALRAAGLDGVRR